MTKADYVRNTASSKAPVEILEYLYDNLIYAQFIYVENVDDIKRRVSEPVSADGGSGFFSAIGAGGNNASSRVKVDAYAMIAQGRTTELNPDILSLVPEESPFSYTGTADQFDVESLNDAFSRAPSIEIVTQRGPALPTGSSWGGDSPYSSTAMMTTLMLDRAPAHTVSLRVTKVGCVSRKDDLEGGKKAQSRKWRTCGMILTSSQLLFFRDLIWTSALDQQISAQTENHTVPNVVIAPRISFFRPDGVLSLSNAFAVRDITHKKYENVFRLIADQGGQTKQFLFQTPSEAEMNDWIAKINFCGTFRSGGIRMRGLDPAPEDDDDAASVVNRSATFDSSTMSRRPSATPSLDGMTLPGAALPSATPSPTSGTYSGQLGAALSQEASPLSSPSIFGGQSSAGSTPLVGVMRRRVYARRRELKPFIREVTEKLQEKRSELDDNLRLARHFAVLTPFQKVTRDRIEAAAVPLSQKIRELRLEVARHASRRDILLLELVAGDRAARAAGPPSSFVLEPEEHSRSPRLRQSFSSVNATERGIVAPSLELPSMSRSSSNRMAKRVSAGGQGLKIYTSRARDNEEADPSPLGDRSPRTPEWRHSSTGFVAVTPASNANFHSPSSVLATPESATSNRSADSYSFHMRQMEEKPRGIQALSHRSP
ncbi:PH-domain-containing protein [Ceraceosorus guamensis]|uniref:PH-domain-containing protein n=1 Tax=Ceraceosorus guamensis TaxID=1522189 RepID=A0A316VWU6_9BASI|nr:PH-domain-containing protein [Ceraceosorus guamensis]PWN41950.1 PH-domain-containing protein [Ceraceosorus guamensis]